MTCLAAYSIVVEAHCPPVWGAAASKKDAEGTWVRCAPSCSLTLVLELTGILWTAVKKCEMPLKSHLAKTKFV